jgi:uncharacterized protein (DUF1778 family)
MTAQVSKRRRSERIEVRATSEDRQLIDRAVAVAGTDLTEFVMSNLKIAARRVLADRTEFVLDAAARRRWDEINNQPAMHLPGLAALMVRPSPFSDE